MNEDYTIRRINDLIMAALAVPSLAMGTDALQRELTRVFTYDGPPTASWSELTGSTALSAYSGGYEAGERVRMRARGAFSAERDDYPWGDASSISVDLTKGEGY